MTYHVKTAAPIGLGYNSKYDIINDYDVKFLICHCWWSGLFSEKQLFTIKSFIVTQKTYRYQIIIWHDRDFKIDRTIENVFCKLSKKHNIKLKLFQPENEICGFSKSDLWLENSKLQHIADNVRIILFYKYGGFWFDLDCCFLRDMNHLFKDEFAYEWEFQNYGNNALMFFRQGSPVLNELIRFSIKNRTFAPHHILSYSNAYISQMKIYPCYLFDPAWMGCVTGMPIQNDFYKFFTSKCTVKSYKEFSPNSYVYHWHNNWDTAIADDSYFRVFEAEFNDELQKL